VTEKGQVTIPKALRDAFGIAAGSEVEFDRTDDAIVIRRPAGQPSRARQALDRLRGRGDVALTTDQIMALTRREE
jgi:AbrB family looped-hinge helix DNA binding protein